MENKALTCILLYFCVIFTAYAGWLPIETREYNPEARDSLIAHEWGTKLNVQGSDGSIYDGLYFKKELAVPDFVYQFSEHPPLTSGQQGIVIKPILYFYAEEPIEIRVEVVCENGTWLEWYPRAIYRDLLSLSERLEAKENEAKAEKPKTDKDETPRSSRKGLGIHKPLYARELTWWGEIIPPSHSDYPMYAEKLNQNIPQEGWYPITRKTDSAIFRARFDYPWVKEVEKFLFYRGSSNAVPDIKVSHREDSSILFIEGLTENPDSKPLFYVDNSGGKNAILLLDQAAPLINTEIEMEKALRLDSAEAKIQLSKIGQAAGLYKKEADGMAEIWAKDYFERPGRRLLYQIGTETLEAEQPLSISPTPKELVRFQIGWLELPTDDTITRIKHLIRRFKEDESVLPEIRAEGFLAHPFMWELYHQTNDKGLRDSIHEYFISEENGI